MTPCQQSDQGGEVMSFALRLWQDDQLHAQMEEIMLQHMSLIKEVSTANLERKQEIMQEIEQLRQQRERLLNQI